jgi:hypothetical protein
MQISRFELNFAAKDAAATFGLLLFDLENCSIQNKVKINYKVGDCKLSFAINFNTK